MSRVWSKELTQEVLDAMLKARYAQLVSEGLSHRDAMMSIKELFEKTR